MSTKIYDAYKITIPEGTTLVQFCKELSEKYFDEAFKDYCRHIAKNAVMISEGLALKKRMIHGEYIKQRDGIIDAFRISLDNAETPEESLRRYDAIELATMMTDDEIRRYHGGYDADIAIFDDPVRPGRNYLIMAFGPLLASMLEKIAGINNPDNPDNLTGDTLISKYGIRDYHYQNQTDRPDGISEAEWDKRRDEWDVIMPSGIPSKDGLAARVLDEMRFMLEVSRKEYDPETPRAKRPIEINIKKFLETDEFYSDTERRLDSYAREIAAADYVKSSNECDPESENASVTEYNLTMEFLRDLERKKPEAVSRFDRIREDIDRYVEECKNGDMSLNIDDMLKPLELE